MSEEPFDILPRGFRRMLDDAGVYSFKQLSAMQDPLRFLVGVKGIGPKKIAVLRGMAYVFGDADTVRRFGGRVPS